MTEAECAGTTLTGPRKPALAAWSLEGSFSKKLNPNPLRKSQRSVTGR